VNDGKSETTIGEGAPTLAVTTTLAAWLVYVFLMAPIFVVIGMSFGSQYEYQFPPRSISLFLYWKFFSDPQWIAALWLSVRVALMSTLLALAFGLSAAYGLVRGEFPGKRMVTLLLMSPILVPVVVIALGLYFYFARLHLIGSYPGLVAAHTIYTMPFVLVTAMAGLRHVDPNLEAAGEVMGAGRLTIFWRITLPLLKPAIVVGALFAFLMSFDEVVIAFFVLEATSFTLPVKMYGSIQFDNSPVLAAVSSFLTLLSVCICGIGVWLQRNR
jgi:putative spermidine/putrescine transport system permease protein